MHKKHAKQMESETYTQHQTNTLTQSINPSEHVAHTQRSEITEQEPNLRM